MEIEEETKPKIFNNSTPNTTEKKRYFRVEKTSIIPQTIKKKKKIQNKFSKHKRIYPKEKQFANLKG